MTQATGLSTYDITWDDFDEQITDNATVNINESRVERRNSPSYKTNSR